PFSEWQAYSFSRTAGKKSFSQVLFELLGLPEVPGDKGSNITMHQILRLMCVDQLSNVQSVFRDEQFDPPLTRTTVAEMLFGIFDDKLYSDQLSLRSTQQRLDSQKIEFASLENALKETGQLEELEKTPEAIGTIQRELAMVQYKLANPSVEVKAESGSPSETITSAQAALANKKTIFSEEARKATFLDREIEDSISFISNLQSRLSALQESVKAEEVLGHLALQLCPECLQPLTAHSVAGHCHLCKQPASEKGRKNTLLKIQNELSAQIDESMQLLERKKDEQIKATRRRTQLKTEVDALQRNFDDLVNVTRPSRDVVIDALFFQRGKLEAQLSGLHNQLKLASRLAEIGNSIKQLKKDILDLEASIKDGGRRQEARRQTVVEAINRYALEFLKNDLDREKEFEVAQNVVIDFVRNFCLVDGRSNFSASSMAYLKGAIHFAIFFASLEVPFFRYPKFIINDNIEDKGMEEIRSKNFQKIVVRLSKNSEIRHQIIIATSMIEPEFDNSEFCIGPKYNRNFKTLRFPDQA
ncbi:MAG: hypothetical protein ABIP97_13345, partial [Chthoniobacterales bacterium]